MTGNIYCKIEVMYLVDELNDLLDDAPPEETTIEPDPMATSFTVSRRWTVTHDEIIKRASDDVKDAHPTLHLDVGDAQVTVDDDRVTITFDGR